MGALIIIVVVLLGVFVWRPAEIMAKATRAQRLKLNRSMVSSDDVVGLTMLYASVIYLLGWWFLEVTGLLSLISNEF